MDTTSRAGHTTESISFIKKENIYLSIYQITFQLYKLTEGLLPIKHYRSLSNNSQKD